MRKWCIGLFSILVLFANGAKAERIEIYSANDWDTLYYSDPQNDNGYNATFEFTRYKDNISSGLYFGKNEDPVFTISIPSSYSSYDHADQILLSLGAFSLKLYYVKTRQDVDVYNGSISSKEFKNFVHYFTKEKEGRVHLKNKEIHYSLDGSTPVINSILKYATDNNIAGLPAPFDIHPIETASTTSFQLSSNTSQPDINIPSTTLDKKELSETTNSEIPTNSKVSSSLENIKKELSKYTPNNDKTGNVLFVIFYIIFTLGFIAFCLFIYFIPSVIAYRNRKANFKAIFALNLFLGGTFIGWVAALVWALSIDQPRH